VQGRLADIWKRNVMEDLKRGLLNYEAVGNFLVDLKEEFGRGDNGTIKIVKLKKIEQKSKMMKKFVQEFRRAVRGSRYERRPLIEEFKQGMNGTIMRKLIEAERSFRSIEQWYERAINLDRHWRESRQEQERLRGIREAESSSPRWNTVTNVIGAQR